jgi:TRAP transporter TAXI family solute receptor
MQRNRTTRLIRRAALYAGVAVTLLGTSLAAAQHKPVNLTIGSFAQGSSWYVYSVTLGELLRGVLPAGSTVDTPPIAGGMANPQLVAAGKAQLAFGMAVVGAWALEGKNGFEAPLPQLRALVGGWDDYFLVPIARGTGYRDDLEGFFRNVRPNSTVMLLQRGSIGALGGQQLLEIAGADEKGLTARGGRYEYGTFDMVKNRLSRGTADVFVQVATVGHPSITEISQTTPITFLEPAKPVLDAMTQRYGWGTKPLPKGAFPGQYKDVMLPSTTTVLFASTDMSEELAYTIVKTVCERTDRLRAAHKALSEFDCANGAWKREVTGLPLHAGAEKYFRERGWLK